MYTYIEMVHYNGLNEISQYRNCQYFEWIILNESHLMFVMLWPGLCDLWWSQISVISAGCRVPPSAGVIMTLTGIMTLLTPDCWLVTPLTLPAAPPPPSSLRACSPLLAPDPQSSWPLARERGGDVRAPPAATWHSAGPGTHWATTNSSSWIPALVLCSALGAVQHGAVPGVSHWSCLLLSEWGNTTLNTAMQVMIQPRLLYRTIGALFIAGISQNAASKHHHLIFYYCFVVVVYTGTYI